MATPAHDHEFMVESPDDWGIEWDSEGGIIAYVNCSYRPLIASATDYERDEVYEEYGDRCEATMTIYWDFQGALYIDDAREQEVPVEDEQFIHEELIGENISLEKDEHNWRENKDLHDFVAMADTLDVGDETVKVVEHDGHEYELVWEVADLNLMG